MDPAAQLSPDVTASRRKRLGRTGLLAAGAATLPPVGGFVVLGLMGPLGAWLSEHLVVGVMVYVVVFVLAAGLALLPTYAQAVLGGYAFGFALGLPAALVGFTGASAVAYGLTRRLAGRALGVTMDRYAKLALLRRALLSRGGLGTFAVVALVRLPPNGPFALTNVALTGLGVALKPYLLGTVVGMIPRTTVAVYLGAGLATLDLRDLASDGWFYVGLGVTAAVMVTLGLLAYRVLHRMAGDSSADARVAGPVAVEAR